MSRQARVWWNKQKKAWCTELGGSRRILAKGRRSKKFAEELLKAALKEQELLAAVNGAITVARLCEEFLADAQDNLAPKTYESYQYACQKFVDTFGRRDAHTIRSADILSFAKALKKTLNDTSRAIVLRSVERCFNWGVEQQHIPPHQFGRIRKPQSKPRDRYLTDDEFRLILRESNPRTARRTGAAFRRLLLAMEWTLCRPGELASLKWEHVQFDQDVAILRQHKTKRTGKPKIIPLIPKMKRLLLWLKNRSTSEFCFVNSYGKPWTTNSVDKRMSCIRDKCGLRDVVPYTMRHRAATNSILRTGDLKMTSLLLGHTSTATTERYTHLAQEHLVNFAKKAVG